MKVNHLTVVSQANESTFSNTLYIDAVKNQILVFGSEVVIMDLDTLKLVATLPKREGPFHMMHVVEHNRKLFWYSRSTEWVSFDLDTRSWATFSPQGEPTVISRIDRYYPAVCKHSVDDHNYMAVLGGSTHSDLLLYDLDSNTLTKPDVAEIPNRQEPSLVSFDSFLYAFFGPTSTFDMFRLKLDKHPLKWEPLTFPQEPYPRCGSATALIGHHIVCVGGYSNYFNSSYSQENYLKDIWSLDFDTGVWKKDEAELTAHSNGEFYGCASCVYYGDIFLLSKRNLIKIETGFPWGEPSTYKADVHTLFDADLREKTH